MTGRPAMKRAATAGLLFSAAIFTACSGSGASSLIKVGSVHALDYHSLAFSPSDRNTLFFGHHSGIMESQDGGKTWVRNRGPDRLRRHESGD